MGRQITPHFNEDELRCRCGCGRMEFSDEAVWRLERFRLRFGYPMRISSGYRCPTYNAQISAEGSLDGPHTQTADDAITVDILAYGRWAHDLVALAAGYGFRGIGSQQKGPIGDRFIHLDSIRSSERHPRPWHWSY